MTGSYEILRKAFTMYVNKNNYCYFYGAKYVVLTDSVMDNLISAEEGYFSRYSESDIERIKNFSRGKIGIDCSGFVGACVGKMVWSGGLIESCTKITSPREGKAGCVLYKPGHVALDIGYGFCIHCGRELETIRIDKLSTLNFTKSGEFEGYDYSEAVNY